MSEVIAPAVQEFKGELVLKYHEFLTMVPSGTHSFTHGSEMVSKTVYWVSVARTTDGKLIEVPKVDRPRIVGGLKNVFTTSRKFLIPALWHEYLSPQYRNSHQPYFAITPKKTKEEDVSFDVAYFGEHLFRLKRGQYDWATKVEIAFGNESVREWLEKTKSVCTYGQLSRA